MGNAYDLSIHIRGVPFSTEDFGTRSRWAGSPPTVLPSSTRLRFCTTDVLVVSSSADVNSSNKTIGDCMRTNLAIATLCFSPPLYKKSWRTNGYLFSC